MGGSSVVAQMVRDLRKLDETYLAQRQTIILRGIVNLKKVQNAKQQQSTPRHVRVKSPAISTTDAAVVAEARPRVALMSAEVHSSSNPRWQVAEWRDGAEDPKLDPWITIGSSGAAAVSAPPHQAASPCGKATPTFLQGRLLIHQGEIAMSWKERYCIFRNNVLYCSARGPDGHFEALLWFRNESVAEDDAEEAQLSAKVHVVPIDVTLRALPTAQGFELSVLCDIKRLTVASAAPLLPYVEEGETVPLRFAASSHRDALLWSKAFGGHGTSIRAS